MAKGRVLLDLQTTGKAAYEAKKYVEALDAFNQAVTLARKWSPSEMLPILDQRVAVHFKLGKLDMARKDAMNMIRSNKSDGRGYLRCGQLDRLDDDFAAAIRWYEHGMKQVSRSDPIYVSIQMQLSKTKILLDKKVTLSKSRDPILTLPPELVQLIIAHLDYIDVVKALQVTKSWKQTLLRLKPLTDTVDFSDARRTINYKMMSAALKRLGPKPKVLIMSELAETATNLLRMNLERAHNYSQLEVLRISSTVFGLSLLPFNKYFLKSLTIKDGRLRDHMVVQIMKTCNQLETARFLNIRGCLSGHEEASWVERLSCRSVRTLELGGDRNHYSLSIYPTFLSYFPGLRELECRDLKICHTAEHFDLSTNSSLQKLKFSSCSIWEWPKLPPTIEVWDNFDIQTRYQSSLPAQWVGELSRLRFLRFGKTSIPPRVDSFLPRAASQSITHVDTRGTTVRSSLDYFDLVQAIAREHLINLRELAIGGVDQDSDLVLALLCLRKLEVLSLTSSLIEGYMLVNIIQNCRGTLRQVTLIDCHYVQADTINWARDHGIQMHVKKSESAENPGRRLHA